MSVSPPICSCSSCSSTSQSTPNFCSTGTTTNKSTSVGPSFSFPSNPNFSVTFPSSPDSKSRVLNFGTPMSLPPTPPSLSRAKVSESAQTPAVTTTSSATTPVATQASNDSKPIISASTSPPTRILTLTKKSVDLVSSNLKAEISSSLKGIQDLLDAAKAPTVSTSTGTLTNEAKKIVQGFLDKDYACLSEEGQRAKLCGALEDLIKDKFFQLGVGLAIQDLLTQLENRVLAFQEAQVKWRHGQTLVKRIENAKNSLELNFNSCNEKKRKFEELENNKRCLERKMARISAEIKRIVEESHPLQARLQESIQLHADFSVKNGGYQEIIDIDQERWGSFKNVLQKQVVGRNSVCARLHSNSNLLSPKKE